MNDQKNKKSWFQTHFSTTNVPSLAFLSRAHYTLQVIELDHYTLMVDKGIEWIVQVWTKVIFAWLIQLCFGFKFLDIAQESPTTAPLNFYTSRRAATYMMTASVVASRAGSYYHPYLAGLI